MESIRSLYERPVRVFTRWWSRISKSNIFKRRESMSEQTLPPEMNYDEVLEAAEEFPAAIYIDNVFCMFGTHWIKDMLTPYGRIKRIACFRFKQYVCSYLVIFSSEDEAKAALNGMKDPPVLATDFKFNFVNHERLMNHYNSLLIPDDNVDIIDY